MNSARIAWREIETLLRTWDLASSEAGVSGYSGLSGFSGISGYSGTGTRNKAPELRSVLEQLVQRYRDSDCENEVGEENSELLRLGYHMGISMVAGENFREYGIRIFSFLIEVVSSDEPVKIPVPKSRYDLIKESE